MSKYKYNTTRCNCKTDRGWDPSYTPEQIKKFKKNFYIKHECSFTLLSTLNSNNKEFHCCKCNRRIRILDGKEFLQELYPKVKSKINLRR